MKQCWYIVLIFWVVACTQAPAAVVIKDKNKAHKFPSANIAFKKPNPDSGSGVESYAIAPYSERFFKPVPVLKPTPYETLNSDTKEFIANGNRIPFALLVTKEEDLNAVLPPKKLATQKMNNTGFIWPIEGGGRVVSSFGTKPGGIRNDGINIAAKEGSPIKAVADGYVMYVGNALQRYGNLVIIKHENSWISAYGYAKDIQVEENAVVRQGEVIGYMGGIKGNNAPLPQLHFTLRQNKRAVDPEKYLSHWTKNGPVKR